MNQLFDTMNDRLDDLKDLIMSSDVDQMTSTELTELCATSAELITLFEKNEKELGEMFGPDSSLKIQIDRLKFCAVTIKRVLPMLSKVEEEIGHINDDVPDIMEELEAAVEVDMGGNGRLCGRCYNSPCTCQRGVH